MSMAPPLGDLVRLALELAGTDTRREKRRTFGHGVGVVVAGLAAAACALAALACALAALWIYAVPHVGAVAAPLSVAGVLLVLCLVLLGLLRHGLRSGPVPPASASVPLLAEVTHLVQDYKVPVLIAALLTGFLAGNSEK